MVSIRDVAKEANVSISTVSKVFNGYTDINEKTKEKILQIAAELNYVPNLAARTLSSKKQKKIALVLNNMNFKREFTMPMEVLSGVYTYAEENGYEFVFLATSTTKQKEKTFSQFCKEHDITGAVIQGLNTTDSYYHEIKHTNLPTVLIDLSIENNYVGTISIDNERASLEAMQYLLDLGHKNIAFVNGKNEAEVTTWREQGYREALVRNKLKINDKFIKYADFDEQKAYAATQELLEDQTITAVFCASDTMAIGAMRAIKDANLRIPEDIALVGFDNIVLSEHLHPSLTTIAQEMEEMGYEAAKLLNDLLNNPSKLEQHRILPHKLIIRESTNLGKEHE